MATPSAAWQVHQLVLDEDGDPYPCGWMVEPAHHHILSPQRIPQPPSVEEGKKKRQKVAPQQRMPQRMPQRVPQRPIGDEGAGIDGPKREAASRGSPLEELGQRSRGLNGEKGEKRQPEMNQPQTNQPEAKQPEANERETNERETNAGETNQGKPNQGEPNQGEATQGETNQRETIKRETIKREATQGETEETHQRETTQRDPNERETHQGEIHQGDNCRTVSQGSRSHSSAHAPEPPAQPPAVRLIPPRLGPLGRVAHPSSNPLLSRAAESVSRASRMLGAAASGSADADALLAQALAGAPGGGAPRGANPHPNLRSALCESLRRSRTTGGEGAERGGADERGAGGGGGGGGEHDGKEMPMWWQDDNLAMWWQKPQNMRPS